MDKAGGGERPVLVLVRRILLFVLVLGMTGTLTELTLIGHYEDLRQRIPLALLTLGLCSLGLQLLVPVVWSFRLFRATMALFVVGGIAGMYFHYHGSREFQLEMDPSLAGLGLAWKVLHAKAPPTLSPGAMIQMGILGLAYGLTRRTR